MKKLSIFICALFAVVTVSAQRVAVLDFNAGVGVSQADVDGISAIFNTYFSPRGYTLVERTQIDRVIDEQNFQRGKLTQAQMVRIGEILNVSKVVIGDVNIVMNQYNVDVRVVNVESGTISAKDGATWAPGSSYRTMMSQLGTRLAGKIAITPTAPVTSSATTPTSSSVRKRTTVEVVMGYLKVFPTELGVFPSEPTSVIAQINNQHMHDYDTWRIPTAEELALLRANGYLKDTEYMTKESGSGMVLLVTTRKSIGSYQIGDYYKDDKKEGIIVKVPKGGSPGMIMSLYEKEIRVWTNIRYDGSLTTSMSDGLSNTRLIKNRSNYGAAFPSIAWVSSLGEEWYLPAIEEWVVIMRNKDEINSGLLKLGVVPISDGNYISSHIKPGASSSNGSIDEYYHYYISNGSTWSGAGDYKIRAVAKF